MRSVSPKTDLDRLKDQQAKEVLLAFLQDIAIKRQEMIKAYLIPLQQYPQDIERPQVFFSYAWGHESDVSFQSLQTFLKDLEGDFEQAGISVWLDRSRMIGDVEAQMRWGVSDSNLILLMGTRLYAQKTMAQAQTNVKKELDFSRQQAQDIQRCTLVPWVLEGTFQAVFPNLGLQYLMPDASPWLSFDQGNGSPIQDVSAYIAALTSLKPMGLLGTALGLMKEDYPDYRKNFRKSYGNAQELLMRRVASIYASSGSQLRDKPFSFSVKRIDFKDLHYEYKRDRIGKGSFGTVYKGTWNALAVAVKEIDGTLTEESTAHFNIEAEAMTKANSPWVVSLYGIAKEGQRAALVMELMPKGSLYQLLHNNETLSWELRYRIAADIACGLLVLHGKGIIHRDLKSENVLLDGHLRAKLSDFGLSKIKSASHLSSHRGGSVGSLGWKAPELFHRKDPVSKQPLKSVPTEQSDIWAYSVVLWEMSSSQLPYDGKDFEASELREYLDEGGRESIPACHPSFAALIEGGWKQKPEERLSLGLMLERLHALSALESSAKESLAPVSSPAPVVFSRPAPVTPPRVVAAVTSVVPNSAGLSVSGLREALPAPTPARIIPFSPVVEPSNVVAFRSPSPPKARRPLAPAELPQFLKLVAEGEQDQAEAMLQPGKNPDLVLFPGNVKDLSGRTFEGITGFQYAVWALDFHMWTMLRRYLPDEQAAAQLMTTGSWVSTHGLHAGMPGGPLDKLIKAYDGYAGSGYSAEHWQKQVGGAQLYLPAHAINEFCRPDRSFSPCPAFLEPTLPRTRKIDEGEWFTAAYNGGKLGEKFGLGRAAAPVGRGCDRGRGLLFMGDRAACVSLTKVRTQQRDQLASDLSSDRQHTAQRRLGT